MSFLSENLSLEGKTALVCGASQGIGAAAAAELAALGARVILLARNVEKLNMVSHTLTKNSKEHICLPLDLSQIEDLRDKVQALLEQIGPIEVLICNSGGPKGGPLLESNEESFLNAFRAHVLASNTLAYLLVPGMKERGYGRIINVISTSVKMPIANLGVSNTIRAAVASWSKTLSSELGPYNITVNNVLPGYTATDRLQSLMQATALRINGSIEDVEQKWKDSVPLRRFADSRETAQAIAFLASPAASYINGVNLPVDGGRTGCL